MTWQRFGGHWCNDTAKVKGRVWDDADRDGKEDYHEHGLRNVTVELVNKDGHVVATTKTDHHGRYDFDTRAGEYQIRVHKPEGKSFTQEQAAGTNWRNNSNVDHNGESDFFYVGPGKTICEIDAGVKPQPKGWVMGRVTYDDDCDNTEFNTQKNDNHRDYDSGICGLKVKLLDLDGKVVAVTRTGRDGGYQFDVPAGEYRVQFEKPHGKKFAEQDVGVEHADSDANEYGLTDVIRVEAGRKLNNIDASLKDKGGEVKGRIWNDEDCDGKEDRGEDGVDGVKVELLTKDGHVVATTHTDHNGRYHFEDVDPGKYKIQVTRPDGTSFTVKDARGTNWRNDSDVNDDGVTDVFTVRANKTKKNIDAGLKAEDTGSISGRYFVDENCDGLETPGEAPVRFATITLLDAHGNFLLDENGERITTLTDENGRYHFDDLAPGEYRVVFSKLPLEGFDFTAKDVGGDDAIDSDVDGSGLTDGVFVESNKDTGDVDAGYKLPEPGAISGRYFCDENANGVDDGEEGVAGKTVELINAQGQVVDTVTTATDGSYRFEDVDAGDYTVRFESSEADGKAFIRANVGDDDGVDSDVVRKNGETDPVSVIAGETADNVDAGVVKPCETEVIDFENFHAGDIVDQIVLDDVLVSINVQGDATHDPNNPDNDAMIFDSSNPTGDDPDLATPNQGNVLILTEDDDPSDPDDNSPGGIIDFDFSEDVNVDSLVLIDVNEGTQVIGRDANGQEVGSVTVGSFEDGQFDTIDLNFEDVRSLEIVFTGSGAVDDIKIEKCVDGDLLLH